MAFIKVGKNLSCSFHTTDVLKQTHLMQKLQNLDLEH